MKKFDLKILLVSLMMALCAPLSAMAEDDTIDWIVGCCLSPDPVQCFSEGLAAESSQNVLRKAEVKNLSARVTDMSERGVFDYAIKTRAETGFKSTKLVSSCKPNNLLDMFEKRISVKEISSICNVKPL